MTSLAVKHCINPPTAFQNYTSSLELVPPLVPDCDAADTKKSPPTDIPSTPIVPPLSTPVNDNMFWVLHSTAINPDTHAVAECDELSKCSEGALWVQANTEEFGQLAQGLGPNSDMPTGTDTIFFIHPNQMPNGCKATYLQIVCADRPEKTQPRRVRHTIRSDQIDYPSSTSTKTADLPTVKTLFIVLFLHLMAIS
jgi:hypothetical protein